MSWQLAAKAVYKSLINEAEYPIQCLNRFKTGPRVRIGPRSDSRDNWDVMNFGSDLQRSRRHWFVFRARSRFYAIEATSPREAKRAVDQYRPIRVPVNSPSRTPTIGVVDAAGLYPPTRGRRDGLGGSFGVDLAQLQKARSRLLGVLKGATTRPMSAIQPFRNVSPVA
jgi:hypothetical protein